MNKLSQIKVFTLRFICATLILACWLPVSALTFNPNYIISDTEVIDYTTMSLSQVQRFLESRNSFLSDYSTLDNDGKSCSAAEIIFEKATTNKINPQFLLVLLQKEQGLVEDPAPGSSQLDWATGYGCPDSGGCNSRWQGFYKQVNSASLQFRDYIDNPHLYNYRKDSTYVFKDKTNDDNLTLTEVIPANNATAALYNYTPHVYDGNYNFWRLWQNYFTKSYPDGSLLQEKGQPGIWLIQYDKKRAFMSKAAFLSRYSLDKVIEVNHNDLEKYEAGDPIKFAQYSLLRSPRGTVYLLVDDTKRGMASGAIFKKLGYSKEEIIDTSFEELDQISEGAPITEKDLYPTGALLQDKKTGGVFFVYGGTKYPLWGKELLKINFSKMKIIPVNSEELDNWVMGEPVKIKDGELVKTKSGSTVYIISNGKRLPIASAETFNSLGYKWEQIKIITDKVLELHPEGEILDIISSKKTDVELAIK